MIIFTVMRSNDNYSFNNEKFIYLINNYNFILNYDGDYYEYKKFKDYYIKYNHYEHILFSIKYLNYSGEFHREDGPAWIKYFKNGIIYNKAYYLNGESHRDDGPAYIHYDENGKIIIKSYYLHGKKHFYVIFYLLNYIKYYYKEYLSKVKKLI